MSLKHKVARKKKKLLAKPRTFWVQTRSNTSRQARPKFADVVSRLYQEYAKYRGNIVGKTLIAPDGATTRQISLALTKVREGYSARRPR